MKNELKHINIELTKACNLACTYCFNNSGIKNSDELDTNTWKDKIKDLKLSGIESILFTGGEIMLRQDIAEIIDYTKNKKINTSILSNGLNLTNEKYRPMIKSLDRVQISLDSASPYSHDLKRGEKSWQIARDAIEYVRELGIPVEISSTISNENLQELDGLAGIAYLTDSKLLIREFQTIGRANNDIIQNIGNLIKEKKEKIINKFGNIFVDDFAMYVPILGTNHDKIVAQKGYATILSDGKYRGDIDAYRVA